MALETKVFPPGTRVRVIQQVAKRDETWLNTIEGEVVQYRQAKTGSWFAHARGDRLWLDRLELRLDDGELITLNLDQYSRIEPVEVETPKPGNTGASERRP